MHIHMPDQIVELENKKDSAEEVVRLIDEFADKQNLLFSHMVIDDQEIYEDPFDYVIERWREIHSIEIVFRTPKEYAGEVLLSISDYLSRAVPGMRFLVDACYKGLNEESWGNLAEFLEGLQWIHLVLSGIKQERFPVGQTEPYILLYDRLEHMLPQLASAVERSDSILIGDLLNYEIVPFMESIQAEVQKTIDNEVPRNDIN